MCSHECSHDDRGSGGMAFRPADDHYEAAADRAADTALSARPNGVHRATAPTGGGPGRPLTATESAYFEPRFGADFSPVRIHADPAARAAAESINARAFTRGSAITFAHPPQLSSAAGRRLFAHELAHVVQQSRTPSSLAGAVQRDPDTPAPGIVRVVIYRKARKINVTLTDGTIMPLIMNTKTTLDAGEYQGKHEQGDKGTDAITTTDGAPVPKNEQWYFFHPTKKPMHNWPDLATSEYDIIVYDKRKPGAREEELPKAQSGKSDTAGTGTKGTGTGTGSGAGSGDKAAGQKAGAGGGGDTAGGQKAGGQKAGGGGTTKGGKAPGDTPPLPAESDAEKKAKVDALLQQLKDLPDVGGKPFTTDQLDKLAEMTSAELADVLKFLKESAEESDDAIDPSAELDKYLKMSPSDRELLRINQRLMADAKAGPLPERVTIALSVSAETAEKLAKATGQLNENLKNLSRIHAKVTHDTLIDQQNADLDEIDLEKLPVFREMMMLEGLLAGASTKSPAIEESAKDLTKSIAGIRDYVLEEIMWLAVELSASFIIGALTGPIGAGAAAARGTILLIRLNNLRKFLQKVEEVYSTYQRITTIISKVGAGYSAYKSFESNFAGSLAELEKLRDAADDPNLDDVAAAAAADKLAELEDAIVEKMLTQLETNTGIGALLEYFDIPDSATEDDLREILFNIPAGLQELNALLSRYRSSGRDMESVKLLTYKSVLVGVLLYPFVGFLAREIGSRLSGLMAEKDLSDRLLDVIGRASSGKKYSPPGAAKTRKRLGGAKRKPKAKTAETKGKPPDPRKKPSRDADPAKDPAKVDDPTAKKGAPSADESGKPKVQPKPGDTTDPGKKPDPDETTQPKKKPDAPDVDDPAAKKPKDAHDPAKRKDDDQTDKPKDKAKQADPTEAEWLEVKTKVARLPDRNQPDGATRSALRSQGHKIRKKHSKIAKGVSVQPVRGRGEWRIAISRKGVLGGSATADVIMGYRERWEAGREAIAAAVAKLDANNRSKTTIEATIEPFKTAYTYTALDVVHHTTADRSGFTVVGRMGNAPRRDIADVDDIKGLHTGEKADPIPIFWYKDPSWYPGHGKPLKLITDEGPADFRWTDPPRKVTLKSGEVVAIGVDPANVVVKDTLLKRKSTDRETDPVNKMKAALKKAGYSAWQDKDIDHVRDLAFEGTNKDDNLWPLNREKNRHAFNGTWYINYRIQYLDNKDRRTLKFGSLFTLQHKYFKVAGIESRVRGYGGRSTVTP